MRHALTAQRIESHRTDTPEEARRLASLRRPASIFRVLVPTCSFPSANRKNEGPQARDVFVGCKLRSGGAAPQGSACPSYMNVIGRGPRV